MWDMCMECVLSQLMVKLYRGVCEDKCERRKFMRSLLFSLSHRLVYNEDSVSSSSFASFSCVVCLSILPLTFTEKTSRCYLLLCKLSFFTPLLCRWNFFHWPNALWIEWVFLRFLLSTPVHIHNSLSMLFQSIRFYFNIFFRCFHVVFLLGHTQWDLFMRSFISVLSVAQCVFLFEINFCKAFLEMAPFSEININIISSDLLSKYSICPVHLQSKRISHVILDNGSWVILLM